jgi:hypothetical protein
MRKVAFCETKVNRPSQGRLQFKSDSDRIVYASQFLTKESSSVLFSRFDQEISKSFDFRNRLD